VTNAGAPEQLRAVVFDFYGTLTVGASAAERDVARLAVANTLGVDPARFGAAVRGSFHERAIGRTGDLADTLRWLAAQCGAHPTDAEVDAACAERLRVERAFMDPRPEAVDVLLVVRAAGVRIGVLSDCTHELPALWEELPFAPLVDAAVFSIELGSRKPAPAMYAEVCARLGVGPGDCIYVGDGGSNELTGAETFGMRAVQIRGPEFARAHTYDAEVDWDGEVIHALPEVLAIIGQRGGTIRRPRVRR
jgi:putative hydrolase of the HAD superfamily